MIAPESLFVFLNHIDDKGRVLYTGSEEWKKGDVGYIRADIAAGRELNLIDVLEELTAFAISLCTRCGLQQVDGHKMLEELAALRENIIFNKRENIH